MIRDTRKDAAYFKNYIAEEEARFNKFYTKAQQKEEEGNENASKRAYTFVAGFLRNKMIALYSAGAALAEVKSAFEKWVSICDKLPQLQYGDLLTAASLCILLKPKDEIVVIINRLLSGFSDDDMLIEGFRNYLLGNGFVFNSNSIKYDSYSRLKQVLLEPDKASQISNLVHYTSKEWYSAQSDSAWYDSHLEDSDTYFGYWCFECAALAVALSLNVSELSKVIFIPGDLL